VVTEGGKTRTVQVPVPMPEDVSYEGVFGPDETFKGDRVVNGLAVAGGAARGRAYSALRAAGRRVEAAAVFAVPAEGLEEEAEEGEGRFYPAAWLCRVQHAGDWDVNSRALGGLLDEAARAIGLPAGGKAAIGLPVLAKLPADAALRCLFLTGSTAVTLSDQETAGLAKFLAGGGFLIVDSVGDAFYRSVLDALRKALPRARIEELPTDHAIYRGKGMPYSIANGCPLVERLGTSGPAQGLLLDGRLVAFISRGNLGSAWSEKRATETEDAFRMGINLISYALQREGRAK
jgi:hypothetical protein